MKMASALERLFSFPVAAISAALPDTDDALWDAFRVRQANFTAQSATRAIVLKWPFTPHDVTCPILDFDHAPAALREAVMPAAEQVREHFGGKLVRIMLTTLPPGAKIVRHRDTSPILQAVHRCHLPIRTNTGVRFTIGDDDHTLEVGEMYEFDNTRPHAVTNDGDESRVHLICDVLPEAVAD